MPTGYTPLTSQPVTDAQFTSLVAGTALERVVRTGGSQPVDVEVGRRRVRVELMRRGEEKALRIQPAPAGDTDAPASSAAVAEPAPAAPKLETTTAMPTIAVPKAEPMVEPTVHEPPAASPPPAVAPPSFSTPSFAAASGKPSLPTTNLSTSFSAATITSP